MGFLKKFGVLLVKVIGVVTGFGPLLGAAIPGEKDDRLIGKVKDTLQEVADLVLITEGMFAGIAGATGLEKLNAASPFVAQIIQRAEFMVDKEIMDEDKFAEAIRTITGGFADLLNSLKDKNTEIKKLN
ncbi:hypothetical protein LCGC14_1902210 [marine sediment metagenome]|uniref:Uncharacterized protein n=1 Tax=marine sediment metagenome TaxID=412755 RepID=A0A0F9IUB2_9ZZZZ